MTTDQRPASEKQIDYCKDLFRKCKVYYRCLQTDQELRDAVLERTGFDLDNLTMTEAFSIIAKLRKEAYRQRHTL